MPGRIKPIDQHLVNCETSAYLADWLKLVLLLMQTLRLRYGISYKEFVMVETALASASHLMEAHSQSLSCKAPPGRRATHEMKRNSTRYFTHSWIQLTFDKQVVQRGDLWDWDGGIEYSGTQADELAGDDSP